MSDTKVIVDKLWNYLGVPARDALPLVDGWRRTPDSVPLASCDEEFDPEATTDVSIRHAHPDASALGSVIQTWIAAINTGDWDTGWAQYSTGQQARLPFEEFRTGFRSSYIFAPEIWRIEATSSDIRQVDVTFFSIQDVADSITGSDCTFWRNRYSFRWSDRWKIDGSERLSEPGAC